MTPRSPTELVRALYEAINARDYETGFALLDEDFEWLEPEQTLLSGNHRGFDEVRRAIEAQLEVWDEFTIEPEEFHEVGDRVAVPIRQRARGGTSGVEVEIRIGHLWTVQDDKIIRLEVFPARKDARKAALAG
ncbi:MAG TPA: nuclear transport factor 2 family protein [Solirubrobacterales bacterium]|nr:nuclear transport factor 2 family protein [Solirubrobacterales bacterium]